MKKGMVLLTLIMMMICGADLMARKLRPDICPSGSHQCPTGCCPNNDKIADKFQLQEGKLFYNLPQGIIFSCPEGRAPLPIKEMGNKYFICPPIVPDEEAFEKKER